MFNISLVLISILRSIINDFYQIPFINKGIEFIDLHSIFTDNLVISSIPNNFNNSENPFICYKYNKVGKSAKIRNRYNQVPHLTQDTNGKVTNSQLDTTNESQEVSPFPAGDHKAHINRRAQRHSKHKTEQKHKRSTKEVPPWNCQ